MSAVFAVWNLGCCCRHDLVQTLSEEVQKGSPMTSWPRPWPVRAPALPSLEKYFEDLTHTRPLGHASTARAFALVALCRSQRVIRLCRNRQHTTDEFAPVSLSRLSMVPLKRYPIPGFSCTHAPADSYRASPSLFVVIVVAQPLHAAQLSRDGDAAGRLELRADGAE